MADQTEYCYYCGHIEDDHRSYGVCTGNIPSLSPCRCSGFTPIYPVDHVYCTPTLAVCSVCVARSLGDLDTGGKDG